MTHALGRRPLPPGDDRHLQKYGLRLILPDAVETVERTLALPYAYRARMDQQAQGACVGFAWSWAMSILNRQFYDAQWLYREAQCVDEWPGTDYSGTSVRAGGDVLRAQGHRRIYYGPRPVEGANGIAAFHWARTVDEVRTAIAAGSPVVLGIDWMDDFDIPIQRGNEWWIGRGHLGRVRGGHAICCYGASDRRQAVRLVNSWGRSFPTVLLPYDTLQRLLDGITYPGEAATIIDRIGVTP